MANTQRRPEGYTGQEMCNHIVKADFIYWQNGVKLTAEEIWNYSPTGELIHVFTWFEHACKLIGFPQTEQL
jgi:hypothetical protein